MKHLLAAALLFAASPALADAAREAKVSAILEKLRPDEAALRVFLQQMPKGGDLHHHLDGSVWAEDFLKWADDDGWCIDKTSHALTPPPCTAAQREARGLLNRDPVFYSATIDALSLRNFFPGTGTGEASGHDHAFATFPRFGAVMAAHLGDALAVTRQQAAGDNVQYVEQITDPSGAFSPQLLGAVSAFDPKDFDAALKQVAPRLPALVTAARAEYDAAEKTMKTKLGCGQASADPACGVKGRYLYFVLRTFQPAQVFAQTALGFALADADPRFVGINLVAPEDDAVALRDFGLHMRIFQYFHRKYPKVKLSLHAGELALGLVPPSALGFHIRDTIAIAGASRIGHGYEISYERDAAGLMADMAKRGIAVEINLTSNAMTPGVKGPEHPVRMLMRAGVPITLSADDEGVIRIDLTHEYVRAVREQNMTYGELKTAAYNGIRYSFLPAVEKTALLAALDQAFDGFETRVLTGQAVP
jgi:adenosine deaminase